MKRIFLSLCLLLIWACGLAEEKLIPVPRDSGIPGYTLHIHSTNRRDGTAEFDITIAAQAGTLPNDPPPHARLGFLHWDHGTKINHAQELTPRVQDRSLIYTFAVQPGWLVDYSLNFVFTLPPEAPATEESSYHFSLLPYTEDGPNPRENYEALRAYQKTPAYLFIGSSEDYLIDLNGDGRRERLVNFGWRAHRDERSMFTLRHKKWRYIGYVDLGESLKLLSKTRAGWHDFSVDRELARGEVVREFYRWNTRSKLYEQHGSRRLHPPDPIPE